MSAPTVKHVLHPGYVGEGKGRRYVSSADLVLLMCLDVRECVIAHPDNERLVPGYADLHHVHPEDVSP